MKFMVLINIIRNKLNPLTLLKPNHSTLLGRWKITHEPKLIESKVDWANIDHCGCCGVKYFRKKN